MASDNVPDNFATSRKPFLLRTAGLPRMVESTAWILIAILFTTQFVSFLDARPPTPWSWEKLFADSDAVVIATAISNTDTKDTIPFNEGGVEVGVDTKFTVEKLVSGKLEAKEFVIFHYRWLKRGEIQHDPPHTVEFIPAKKNEFGNLISYPYLLFLKRLPDGRYEPVTGQTEPDASVRLLDAPVEEVK